MKNLLIPIALAVTLAHVGTASRAATVDLTTFSGRLLGANSGYNLSSEPVFEFGTAEIFGTVSRLSSFEWNFTAGDLALFNDYSYYSIGQGQVLLSDIARVGNFGTSGWQTVSFATPYSGMITFGVADVGGEDAPSTLALQNLTLAAVPVSAVPEPETYALMLAGLGFGATVIRRRRFTNATT